MFACPHLFLISCVPFPADISGQSCLFLFENISFCLRGLRTLHIHAVLASPCLVYSVLPRPHCAIPAEMNDIPLSGKRRREEEEEKEECCVTQPNVYLYKRTSVAETCAWIGIVKEGPNRQPNNGRQTADVSLSKYCQYCHIYQYFFIQPGSQCWLPLDSLSPSLSFLWWPCPGHPPCLFIETSFDNRGGHFFEGDFEILACKPRFTGYWRPLLSFPRVYASTVFNVIAFFAMPSNFVFALLITVYYFLIRFRNTTQAV